MQSVINRQKKKLILQRTGRDNGMDDEEEDIPEDDYVRLLVQIDDMN